MELINLNAGDNVNIGKLPYGTTRDIPIKLGNKLYLLDVQKQATGACIDFYRRVKADRKKIFQIRPGSRTCNGVCKTRHRFIPKFFWEYKRN